MSLTTMKKELFSSLIETFRIRHSLSIEDLILMLISPILSILKFPENSKPSSFTLTSYYLVQSVQWKVLVSWGNTLNCPFSSHSDCITYKVKYVLFTSTYFGWKLIIFENENGYGRYWTCTTISYILYCYACLCSSLIRIEFPWSFVMSKGTYVH